jgi:hypothetical protein
MEEAACSVPHSERAGNRNGEAWPGCKSHVVTWREGLGIPVVGGRSKRDAPERAVVMRPYRTVKLIAAAPDPPPLLS